MLDVTELFLYLAVTHSRDELEELGLGHMTHTRVHKTGPRPGVTTDEILNRTTDMISKFNMPTNNPSPDEAKKMFSVAIEHLIKQAMKNHI